MRVKIHFFLCLLLSILIGCNADKFSGDWSIKQEGAGTIVRAGILERRLLLTKDNAVISELLVNGTSIVSTDVPEFSVTFWKASPNAEPQGIGYSDQAGVEQQDAVKNQTDALNIEKKVIRMEQVIDWTDSVTISGSNPGVVFDSVRYSVSTGASANKLTLSFAALNPGWSGLSAELIYELYNGYPVTGKRIRFINKSDQWMKIGNLVIDDFQIAEPFSFRTFLTPAARGVDAGIVAFSDTMASTGIISASGVPSKLRSLSADGSSGYNPDYFEWVLGPGESFESEPVWIYAFSGVSYPTGCAVSTALDRCAESDFKAFLTEYILRRRDDKKNIAPVFCSWTNYSASINDSNMQTAVDIASRVGFKCFQLDAGWSDTGPNGGWAVSTPKPDLKKFPDLAALSNYIRSKKMTTGLWYSTFINEQEAGGRDQDPPLFSLPLIRRAGGLGLSMCYKPSRESYINDLVCLNKTFGTEYFKQDLSDVCYGDVARGHESRTLKESYLRGLRGLFETQDEIHRQAPDVWLQLSHEIYWETPGPAADVAVLRHADSYHISPNEYWGAGNRSKLVSDNWHYDVDSLKQKLREGAFRCRDLMYKHRGLPLERIEVFGAVTTNFNGSLTPEIQDRQICSWLMGAPLSFSGDLGSLTKENIDRYQNRFAILETLHQKYHIYSCFQYSGVPVPTDEGWHWWGKLNYEGLGAVIVLRGSSGTDSEKIHIPWVKSDKKYHLKALFSAEDLGEFSGEQLRNGELKLSLSPWGQEIIEVAED